MSMLGAKRFLVGASIVTTIITLTACGSENGDDSGAETTLVLGHDGSDIDPRQDAAERIKEIIESESDGRIEVDIHGTGTLGTWEEMVEGLQLGTTDIVIESMLSVEAYTDLATIETAPFLYESPEQFMNVWDGELGDEIKDAVTEDSGYVMLGNMYRGPRHLTTNDPVTSLDDVRGMTVRTPSAETMVETWQSLGARADALPWAEVYSALEQGVIDGQENPLDVTLFNSIYEVNSEITLSAHMYANYHFIMWEDSLSELSEEDQEIVRNAADRAGQEHTDNVSSQQEEYMSELKENGMTFHELSDRDAWIDATQPVTEGLPEQVQDWIAQIGG